MSRILFALARDGLLPQSLASVNSGGTPALTLLLCTFASICLARTGTFTSLVVIASITTVVVYMSGFASLIVLRRREPALSRAI